MGQQVVIRTAEMQRIEAREGRPIDELLRELYVEQGLTLEQVGAALSPADPITKGAVSRWIDRFGIEARRSGPERATAAVEQAS